MRNWKMWVGASWNKYTHSTHSFGSEKEIVRVEMGDGGSGGNCGKLSYP